MAVEYLGLMTLACLSMAYETGADSRTGSVCVLPEKGPHRVAIRGDGRPYAAFRFAFADFETTSLCLWQSDLYQTWQLWASRDSFKACRCRAAAVADWRALAR